MSAAITVSLVNFNHAHYLESCLKAVRRQTCPPSEIIITDNASADGSVDWLRTRATDATVIVNKTNTGYAAAHNEAFRRATSAFVLALNCDVVLDQHFLEASLAALQTYDQVGSACGRLLLGSEGSAGQLDSTGLFPDRFRRFQDRDHGCPDDGRRRDPVYIFGPSGSAAIYRKAMLDDVAYQGEYFDESFFAYCEDADLAWRAQRLGWDSMLIPEATGRHIHADMSRARSSRNDTDASFRQYLLMRNRHLCFLKNDAGADLVRALPWLGGYDLALESYLAVRKPALAVRWPAGVVRQLGRTWAKRTDLLQRQRRAVSLRDWFDWERQRPVPVASVPAASGPAPTPQSSTER